MDTVTIGSDGSMNATTGTFSVSGNWDNSGEFDPKTGTVTLDGTNQTIIGTTTFYELTKNVNSAATLTFPEGVTTTVTNTLNLSGVDDQLLSLRSSSSSRTEWKIDPQEDRSIAYLNVQDSNNVSGTAIDTVGKNIFDSDGNTHWTFVAPTVTTQAVSGIGTTSATGNGTITSLGSNDPTAHGVCWNTSGTPTISDNVKDNGAASATGSFTASITGLSSETTYHVRAFATNNVGTSYGSDLTFTTSSAAPTLTSFSPSSGGATTSVTITGTNFTDATAVTFGGTNASSFTVDSATQITAVVADGSTGKVTVTTPGGTATSSGNFTYYNTPTITSFSPTSGGTGTSVTITGTNFTGTEVNFGGTAASSFTVDSSTQITAVVAGGATG